MQKIINPYLMVTDMRFDCRELATSEVYEDFYNSAFRWMKKNK